MKAIFLGFARGVATMNPRKWVMEVPGITSAAQAAPLAGQKVIWTSSGGKKIAGKVMGAHGDTGHIIANFKKGPPHTVRGHKAELRDKPGFGRKGAAKAPSAAKPAANPHAGAKKK